MLTRSLHSSVCELADNVQGVPRLVGERGNQPGLLSALDVYLNVINLFTALDHEQWKWNDAGFCW